jgi:capsular polysaccharide transport system permease protein
MPPETSLIPTSLELVEQSPSTSAVAATKSTIVPAEGTIVPAEGTIVPTEMKTYVSTIDRYLFLLLFVAPVLVSGIYYCLIASDQYVSEAKFVVRSVSAIGMPMMSSLNKLDVTSSFGLSRATDDTYSIVEYLQSRDVMAELVRYNYLKDILARSEGDIFNRFPNFVTRDSNEALYRHFQHILTAYTDPDTKIGVLEVRAFRAQDAQAIAMAALSYAERFVNRLNDRAQEDTLRFATETVAEARAKLNQTEDKITAFRNQEMVLDPGKQSTSGLDLIAKIKGELASEQTALAQAQTLSPNSPQVNLSRSRIIALQTQIDEQQRAIVGSGNSMAPRVAEYEQLTLERELSAKALAAALISMDTARQEAQKKQLYLERIIEPSLPDRPFYPRRFLMCLLVAGTAGAVFLIVRETVKAAISHA